MSCARHRVCNKNKIIPIEEGRRKLSVINSNKELICVTKADKGVFENIRCADYVVSRIVEGKIAGELIVELKGCDVKHGCEQVLETAKLIARCSENRRQSRLNAIVVAQRVPRGGIDIRRLQALFSKLHKGSLRTRSGNPSVAIEELLA